MRSPEGRWWRSPEGPGRRSVEGRRRAPRRGLGGAPWRGVGGTPRRGLGGAPRRGLGGAAWRGVGGTPRGAAAALPGAPGVRAAPRSLTRPASSQGQDRALLSTGPLICCPLTPWQPPSMQPFSERHQRSETWRECSRIRAGTLSALLKRARSRRLCRPRPPRGWPSHDSGRVCSSAGTRVAFSGRGGPGTLHADGQALRVRQPSSDPFFLSLSLSKRPEAKIPTQLPSSQVESSPAMPAPGIFCFAVNPEPALPMRKRPHRWRAPGPLRAAARRAVRARLLSLN